MGYVPRKVMRLMARGGNKEYEEKKVIYTNELLFYPKDREKAHLSALKALRAKRDLPATVGDELDLNAMSRHESISGPAPRPRPKCKPRPKGAIGPQGTQGYGGILLTVAAEPDIIGGTGVTGTNSCGAR